ncbi:zinc-type alcohol dehydrogenase [Cordyceps militaris]|uniref:Zinc-type alcohol dehydrogenase n=1 Tax=Cordyceps militaris TaxID=73501 RepID=A0A2H4SCI0_CORMI|nr:zinc-type alcohol dehydrogenase [Cordyceps militaris]
MTIPKPTEDRAAAPHPDSIRRNWVHVAAPKNKQWTTAMDGVGKLTLVEAALPTPQEGEVLVKMSAVSLNYRDVQVCEGVFNQYNRTQAGGSPALVPCSDMCGTVVDASRDRTRRFAPGSRVLAIHLQSHLRGPVQESDLASGLGLPLPGVLAQYRCFPAASLVAAPAHLSDAEASCLPLATATAWTALNWMRPLVVGGTVLLQGTSATALAGLQIAKAAGWTAVVTAPTDELRSRARDELGADAVVNYQTHWAWEGDVLRATHGRGADVIFETGDGARTLRKSFKCVAFGGVINCLGGGSSAVPGGGGDDGDGDGKTPTLHRMDVNALALARSVTIKGVLNGGRDRLEEALAFYESTGIRPVVDRTFAFSEAGKALAYVKEGKGFGKVVIVVDEGGDGEKKPEEAS